MNIRRHAIQIIIYAAAILGSLLLIISFARFNTLHEEFLGANFDSVHGARTLLKASFILELVANDLANAVDDTARRSALLARAEENLILAESYGAEGRDTAPEMRNALSTQLQALRSKASALRTTAAETDLTLLLTATRQLAKDFSSAELERWGTLSSANTALAERMQQMRIFIASIILLFVLIMVALGWALTRARRAETDLLHAKSEIEAIQQTTLDASPLGIAYIDATNLKHRLIKKANRQMALIFGYPLEQLLGLETSHLYADRASYEHLSRTLAPKLSAGEVIHEELIMQRQNGDSFWCSLSLKAIDPDALTRGAVLTCEDISERKEIEVALQLTMEKAKAASLAKSEFLANMSHELRTPFAGILGLLDLLQRTELSDTQQRYTRLAWDSTSQMLSIVNDILDFSKIEAGKLSLDPANFDLRRFFSTLAEAHAAAAMRKGLSFTLDLVEPLPVALAGDTVRIRQIVDNLLSNAIKFTLQGKVGLRVECTASNDGTASLLIAVSDTGIGLATDMREHIFQKFSQADASTTRVFGGTGLGLAICQQLATLMGGQVKVDSVLGKGSCFSLALELPLAPAPDPSTLEIASEPFADISGLLVLLVDDNNTNRNVFAELLTQYRCRVETAENGEQAIRLASEIKPDVILMDCQMPIMDGQEATRRIRAAEAPGGHVAIIALTAHATRSDHDSCLASGMDDYLPKPVSPEILVRRIAQWGARRNAAAANTAPPAQRPATQPPVESCQPGRVLLVEDNFPIQEATRRLLECLGCEVVVASHGQAALDIFDATCNSRCFDLVLMDCRMPGMDGWETTRHWRRREQENKLSPTIIIAVTGSDLAEIQQDCRDAGMNDILVKPYPASSLVTLLTDRLGKKTSGDVAAEERQRG